MNAGGLLSSRLMFPTPLTSDKGTSRDAQSLDVYPSENGVPREKNRNDSIWNLLLPMTVFYLTPVASDSFRSMLKPSTYDPSRKNGDLSAQVIAIENPAADTATSNPDRVE